MKSLILSTCIAVAASLAGPQDSHAQIVIHVGGPSYGPASGHYNHVQPHRHAVRGGHHHRHYLPNAYHAYYGGAYYNRPHYFYEWQRPYYGFRANGPAFWYGY